MEGCLHWAPPSVSVRYALTYVDAAGRLLQAYPVLKANQAYTIKALTKLMSAYGHFKSSRVTKGLILLVQ